jgi:DNA-binding transcriptional LysR family regulator
VSQPSLTRAIQRLENELGGLLIHRDGKNTRLTALGQHIAAEFRRVDLALRSAPGTLRAGRWIDGVCSISPSTPGSGRSPSRTSLLAQ